MLHPFPLSVRLGTLAADLGCFPRVCAVYPAQADSNGMGNAYSEVGWGQYPGVDPSPSSALPRVANPSG